MNETTAEDIEILKVIASVANAMIIGNNTVDFAEVTATVLHCHDLVKERRKQDKTQ